MSSIYYKKSDNFSKFRGQIIDKMYYNDDDYFVIITQSGLKFVFEADDYNLEFREDV